MPDTLLFICVSLALLATGIALTFSLMKFPDFEPEITIDQPEPLPGNVIELYGYYPVFDEMNYDDREELYHAFLKDFMQAELSNCDGTEHYTNQQQRLRRIGRRLIRLREPDWEK